MTTTMGQTNGAGTMNYIEQSRAAGRHLMPDLVRAFAIIGIALVNVGYIAYSVEISYFGDGIRSNADFWAYFLVNAVFFVKTYTLFAFMFGVGFAYQMKSAARAGASFKGRYFRRIVGLLVLGLLHAFLAFPGDILAYYAVFGIFLYWFRNAKTKTLVTWGLVFIGVQISIVGLLALATQLGYQFAPDEMLKEIQKMQAVAERSREVLTGGTFVQAVFLRIEQWIDFTVFGLFMQGGGIFGAFLLGFAAVKSNVIANPDANFWRITRLWLLPVGILGSVVGAYNYASSEAMLSPQTMWGMAILFAAAPFSSAGYLGLIAKWAASPLTVSTMTKVKIFMARGGTATLTSYLMQSILLSLIFSNYGLGYYEKLGAAISIAIALAAALLTLVFSSLWRVKFKRGPMEALLRGFTYLAK